MIVVGGVEIKVQDIIQVAPHRNDILVNTRLSYLKIPAEFREEWNNTQMLIKIIDEKLMEKVKYSYRQKVLRSPDPEDRVDYYETLNTHGVRDFEKETLLINSRRTPQEKQKELEELYRLIDLFEKAEIDSEYLKDRVRGAVFGE